MKSEIIGNILVSVTKNDLASYQDLLRRIRKFEMDLSYEKFLQIKKELSGKIKEEKKYIETNPELQDLFKELKIKDKND